MSKHKRTEDENGELHIYAQGKLRGDKVKYKYGESCTVWYPMKDAESIEDEDSGICFDFPASDIDTFIALLQEMKENEADIFVYDEEEEKRRKEWELKQETLPERIKDAFEDLGIHVTPFYWRNNRLMVTRPQPSGKGDMHVHKLCSGIYLGPFCITWGREWDDVVKKVVKNKAIKSILLKTSKLPGISNLTALALGFMSRKKAK